MTKEEPMLTFQNVFFWLLILFVCASPWMLEYVEDRGYRRGMKEADSKWQNLIVFQKAGRWVINEETGEKTFTFTPCNNQK